MTLSDFKVALTNCSPATKVALLGMMLAPVHSLLGALLVAAGAWLDATRQSDTYFAERMSLWFAVPVLMSLVIISYGQSLPSDDLMRHLSAWRLQYDYRSQYPWSTLPKADLWLGFDFLIGLPQQAGVSPHALLQWLPGFGFVLEAVVLYFALKRAVPAHRRNQTPALFLMAGCLGLLLLVPRMQLSRPEAYLTLLAGAAWLCRARWHAAVWVASFVLTIPFYWLGWAYAPFALLLPLGLAARIGMSIGLGLIHLAFWQVYTGNYLGLMVWLKSTLSVAATENAPMLTNLMVPSYFAFFMGIAASLALLIHQSSGSSSLRHAFLRHRKHLPVLVLLVWLALPNQVRYAGTMGIALLPWLLRRLYVAHGLLARRKFRIQVPAVLVLVMLVLTGLRQLNNAEEPPVFQLNEHAKVFSQQPYATVFFGAPGIQVEPSFALGATKAEWKNLVTNGQLNCDQVRAAGFTHVVEKSLAKIPTCLELVEIQGTWRLWLVTPTNTHQSQ